MYISPVSVNYYSVFNKTNFKGQNERPTPHKESKQNNSAEVFMSTETYLNMIAAKGMRMGIQDRINHTSSEFERVREILSEAGTNNTDDLPFDEQIECGALLALYALKAGMRFAQKTPEKLKGKIPDFYHITADDLLKSIAGEANEPKNYMEEQMQYLKENMADFLKREKYAEVSEVAERMNEMRNLALHEAIEAGFKHNARAVVNAFSSDAQNWVKPSVKDNNDGTETYTYKNDLVHLVTVRDKENKDFISAQVYNLGQLFCAIEFRENGSIRRLENVIPQTGVYILMETDAENDKIRIARCCPEGTVEHYYQRQEDGTLRKIL